MSSFEWMDLQSVTTDIAAARSRLSAARRSGNRSLVQALEEEIATAEARRTSLRANTTADVVGTVEPAAHPEASEGVAVPGLPAVAEEARQNEVDEAEPSTKSEGVAVMSDQMMPIDAIERANRQLEARRAEMLARHAEELRTLDADQSEIDAMAEAMNAFLRKFNLASAESSVVRLDDERDMRQQIHG